jgi:hypothetical protein
VKPKKVSAEHENPLNNLTFDFTEDIDILPDMPHKYKDWVYVKDLPVYVRMNP